MKNHKRHFLKGNGRDLLPILDRCINTFQKLSQPSATSIKVPKNIGEAIAEHRINWKDLRAYIRYLDLKVQNPNVGTFRTEHSHRYYQRTIKDLITRGWASRENGVILLRAYQSVWRSMGITRTNQKGILKFSYWKISVDGLSNERKVYLRQIEDEIKKLITERKRRQIRWALGDGSNSVTFSAKSAASMFGYNSPATGSKLRQKYFGVIPMTPEEAKPRFIKERGRFEEPTKQIAI